MDNKVLNKLLAIAAIIAACQTQAQMAITNVVTVTVTNKPTPTVIGAATDLVAAISDGGTNWQVATYGMYAEKLQKKVGGGIGIFWPITQYVWTGVRVDYINGGLVLPSGNATVKTTIHPFSGWRDFAVTPFGYVGVGIPLSGATILSYKIPGKVITDNNGQPTAILGTGLALTLIQGDRWDLSLVGDVETWSGFPGRQIRGGLDIHIKLGKK